MESRQVFLLWKERATCQREGDAFHSFFFCTTEATRLFCMCTLFAYYFFLLFRIIHNLSISILSPLVSIFLFPFLSHYSHGIDQGSLKINVHLRSLNARMRAAGAYDIPLNDISQLQIIEDLANVGVSSLVSVLQRALHRFLLFGPVLLIAREMLGFLLAVYRNIAGKYIFLQLFITLLIFLCCFYTKAEKRQYVWGCFLFYAEEKERRRVSERNRWRMTW